MKIFYGKYYNTIKNNIKNSIITKKLFKCELLEKNNYFEIYVIDKNICKIFSKKI